MWFRRFLGLSSANPSDLETRLSKMESDLKLLRVEWNEVYDKLAHMADRQRKREKVFQGLNGPEPEKPQSDYEIARGLGLIG